MTEATPSGKNSDCLAVSISDIRADLPIPVRLFFYFRMSDHLLLFLKPGEAPPVERLSRIQSRGLKALWIKKEDEPTWRSYLAQTQATPASGSNAAISEPKSPTSEAGQNSTHSAKSPTEVEPQISASSSTGEQPIETSAIEHQQSNSKDPKLNNQNEEASDSTASKQTQHDLVKAVLNSNSDPEAKAQAIQEEAQKHIAQQLAESQSLSNSALAKETRKLAREVLEALGASLSEIVKELWDLADQDDDLTHGINVASYSVLFAMAFGKVDRIILVDLARAGIFHDLGVSKVPSHIAQKAWLDQKPEEFLIYTKHVEYSVELARKYEPNLSEQSIEMIRKSHEQFNGKGYPRQIEGFKLEPTSQVLAIAEMIESIAGGSYDGTVRSYRDALLKIESLEGESAFPKYFNPDIFRTVLKWVKNNTTESMKSQIIAATEVVKEEAKNFTDQPTADKAA